MKLAEGLTEEPMSLAEAVKKLRHSRPNSTRRSICVMHLGIDTKQADQLVRGSLSLPHGIGKAKRVIAFCDESDAASGKGRRSY